MKEWEKTQVIYMRTQRFKTWKIDSEFLEGTYTIQAMPDGDTMINVTNETQSCIDLLGKSFTIFIGPAPQRVVQHTVSLELQTKPDVHLIVREIMSNEGLLPT